MPDFTPRPTVYKGIQMRSRLEAGFAQWLDEWEIPGWEYEPKAFGSAKGQYLPDFWLPEFTYVGREIRTAPAYIEVKPVLAFDQRNELAHRMAVIWESEPDAFLLVAVRPSASTGTFIIETVEPDPGGPDVEGPDLWGADLLFRGKGRSLAAGCAVPLSLGPWGGEWWKGKGI